jgi:hypothetical protein
VSDRRKLQAGRVIKAGLLALILCLVGIGVLRDTAPDPSVGSPHAHKRFVSETNWRRAARDPTAIAVARKVEPQQYRHFSLLRTPAEPLSLKLQRRMRQPTYGVNWDLAQRVALHRGGVLWLLPGNRFLCLLVKTAHLNQICTPTEVAVVRGVSLIEIAAHPRRAKGVSRVVVGVAPDHAAEVRIRTVRGVAVLRTTRDGVFSLRDRSTSAATDLELR